MTSLDDYKSFVPVIEATAIDNHRVLVHFADGRCGIVDFSELIGDGPWRRLADPAFFRLAHAEYDTVLWTDDIDVSPEYVWENATLIESP